LTDGRWRPADDGTPARLRDADIVDVPLIGTAAPVPSPTGDGSDAATQNWRRVVGVSLALGVALGLVVTVVRLAVDDDTDGARGAGGAADPSTGITTPPTLRPLETLPLPDGAARSGSASAEPVNAPTPPAPVTVPSYPPADGAVLSEIVQFDVVAALAHNGEDVARRSDTHIELGYGGYVLDVSIERDPTNDRYRLGLASSGGTEEVIVDVATGTSHVTSSMGDPFTIRNVDIVGPDTDVRDYFDRLLQGPLRTDTYDPVATRGRGLVTIDGIGDAREYVTSVDGDLVPEWQIHAFAPVNEFRAVDLPQQLEYAVYLDDTDRIVQVDGVAMLGNVPQLVQHRITVPDEPIVITLPAESTDEPAATTLP
jgi:hypothetical protein